MNPPMRRHLIPHYEHSPAIRDILGAVCNPRAKPLRTPSWVEQEREKTRARGKANPMLNGIDGAFSDAGSGQPPVSG